MTPEQLTDPPPSGDLIAEKMHVCPAECVACGKHYPGNQLSVIVRQQRDEIARLNDLGQTMAQVHVDLVGELAAAQAVVECAKQLPWDDLPPLWTLAALRAAVLALP